MNAPMPPMPDEVPRYHPCFGGYAACSGVNPCKVCKQVLRDRVDARAVVAASLNGAMLAAIHAMAGALRQMGVEPQQVGVPGELLGITPERQVQAYWTARDAALSDLHREMDGGPLAGAFLVTDVGVSPPAVVQPIMRRYGMPFPTQQPVPHYGYGPPADTVAAPAYEAPQAPQAPPAPGPAPQSSVVEPPHARPHPEHAPKVARPKPMSAADVAAAGIPIAPDRGSAKDAANGIVERDS